MFDPAEVPPSPTSTERPVSTLTLALNKSPMPPSASPPARPLQESSAALLISGWKKSSQRAKTPPLLFGSLTSEDETESVKMAHLAKKRFDERQRRIAATARDDTDSDTASNTDSDKDSDEDEELVELFGQKLTL